MKKTVILNSAKFNYDGKLNFSDLERIVEVALYETSSPDEILKRAEGADILITKELPLAGELIRKLPDSIKLYVKQVQGLII